MVLRTSSSSGRGEGLAGESAGEDVDLSSPDATVDRSDVFIESGGGEVMAKDRLAKGIDLRLKDVLPTHPRCRQIKSTDTGEKTRMPHFLERATTCQQPKDRRSEKRIARERKW